MGVLNRDQILGSRDSKTTIIDVADWGGSVRIRPLWAGEVQNMATLFSGEGGDLASNIEMAFAIVAAGTIDEAGAPLFSSPDDLRELAVGPIIQLASAIAEVSGIAGGSATGK